MEEDPRAPEGTLGGWKRNTCSMRVETVKREVGDCRGDDFVAKRRVRYGEDTWDSVTCFSLLGLGWENQLRVVSGPDGYYGDVDWNLWVAWLNMRGVNSPLNMFLF